MKYLKKAIKKGYIKMDRKKDLVSYYPHKKLRKYSNPEEQVQLQTYLNLIYQYHYPPERLRVSDKVKMGSSTREADVVVYHDDAAKDPFIVVECKRRKISDVVFREAIDQGFSYAAATNAEYVWATSGDKNASFEVWDDAIHERQKNKISRVPKFTELKDRKSNWYKFNSWLDKRPIFTDALLYTLVLLVFTAALSKLTMTYYTEIMDFLNPYINNFNWELNWLYNTIVFAASLLSLIFGGIFMRSHQFFNTPKIRKRANYFFMALILFLPAWYMGISVKDPKWWQESHLITEPVKEWIFLFPYIKSVPFTFFLVFILIWLMGRTKM